MSGLIPTGWYLAYEDGSHGVHEADDPKAIYRERLYRLDDADDLLRDAATALEKATGLALTQDHNGHHSGWNRELAARLRGLVAP